jgi:3-dehydroquinate dehydratase-2
MNKVLIIQGAGMELRGTVQVEVFGPETFEEINAQISHLAADLQLEVEIFHSNDENSVVAKLEAALPGEFAAIIINPAGFTTSSGSLPGAVAAVTLPVYEVHASNPASRGIQSTLLPVCRGAIYGFGYAGYGLALQAIAVGLG